MRPILCIAQSRNLVRILYSCLSPSILWALPSPHVAFSHSFDYWRPRVSQRRLSYKWSFCFLPCPLVVCSEGWWIPITEELNPSQGLWAPRWSVPSFHPQLPLPCLLSLSPHSLLRSLWSSWCSLKHTILGAFALNVHSAGKASLPVPTFPTLPSRFCFNASFSVKIAISNAFFTSPLKLLALSPCSMLFSTAPIIF